MTISLNLGQNLKSKSGGSMRSTNPQSSKEWRDRALFCAVLFRVHVVSRHAKAEYPMNRTSMTYWWRLRLIIYRMLKWHKASITRRHSCGHHDVSNYQNRNRMWGCLRAGLHGDPIAQVCSWLIFFSWKIPLSQFCKELNPFFPYYRGL
jgi:hypothetical protein